MHLEPPSERTHVSRVVCSSRLKFLCDMTGPFGCMSLETLTVALCTFSEIEYCEDFLYDDEQRRDMAENGIRHDRVDLDEGPGGVVCGGGDFGGGIDSNSHYHHRHHNRHRHHRHRHKHNQG